MLSKQNAEVHASNFMDCINTADMYLRVSKNMLVNNDDVMAKIYFEIAKSLLKTAFAIEQLLDWEEVSINGYLLEKLNKLSYDILGGNKDEIAAD